MVKSHALQQVTLFAQNTADLQLKPWKTIPNPTILMLCLWDEWQWASLPVTAHPGIQGDHPDVLSLTKHGGFGWWPSYFPYLMGSKLRTMKKNQNLWKAPYQGTPVRILRRAPVMGNSGAWKLHKGQLSRIRKCTGWWRKRRRLNVMWQVPLHLFKSTYSTV
jgi:hypothetical protein